MNGLKYAFLHTYIIIAVIWSLSLVETSSKGNSSDAERTSSSAGIPALFLSFQQTVKNTYVNTEINGGNVTKLPIYWTSDGQDKNGDSVPQTNTRLLVTDTGDWGDRKDTLEEGSGLSGSGDYYSRSGEMTSGDENVIVISESPTLTSDDFWFSNDNEESTTDEMIEAKSAVHLGKAGDIVYLENTVSYSAQDTSYKNDTEGLSSKRSTIDEQIRSEAGTSVSSHLANNNSRETYASTEPVTASHNEVMEQEGTTGTILQQWNQTSQASDIVTGGYTSGFHQTITNSSLGDSALDIWAITIGPFTLFQAICILSAPLSMAIVSTICVCIFVKPKRKTIPKILVDLEEPGSELPVETHLPEFTFHRLSFIEWRRGLDEEFPQAEGTVPENNRRSFHQTFGVVEETGRCGDESTEALPASRRASTVGGSAGSFASFSGDADDKWGEDEEEPLPEGYLDMRKTSCSSIYQSGLLPPHPRLSLTNSTGALYAVPRVRRDCDYVIPSPLQDRIRQSSSENILNAPLYDVPRRYRANTGPSVPYRQGRHVRSNYQRPNPGLHTRVPSPLEGYQQPALIKERVDSPGASPDPTRRMPPLGASYAYVDKSRTAPNGMTYGPMAGWRSNYSSDGYVEPRKYTSQCRF